MIAEPQAADPVRPLAALTTAQLHAEFTIGGAKVELGKEQQQRVREELLARYNTKLAELHAAGKNTAHVVVDGFKLTEEISKDVSYDSDKLLAIAQTMTWEKASKLFKIRFDMAAAVYTGIAAVDTDLKDKVDEARTVTPKTAPLKFVKVEA